MYLVSVRFAAYNAALHILIFRCIAISLIELFPSSVECRYDANSLGTVLYTEKK